MGGNCLDLRDVLILFFFFFFWPGWPIEGKQAPTLCELVLDCTDQVCQTPAWGSLALSYVHHSSVIRTHPEWGCSVHGMVQRNWSWEPRAPLHCPIRWLEIGHLPWFETHYPPLWKEMVGLEIEVPLALHQYGVGKWFLHWLANQVEGMDDNPHRKSFTSLILSLLMQPGSLASNGAAAPDCSSRKYQISVATNGCAGSQGALQPRAVMHSTHHTCWPKSSWRGYELSEILTVYQNRFTHASVSTYEWQT